MSTDSETMTTGYRGETLDELRMRRAMVAVRLDMQKEVLRRKAQQVMGEATQSDGVMGMVTGGIASRFPKLGYLLTGLKVARMVFRFVRLLRRK